MKDLIEFYIFNTFMLVVIVHLIVLICYGKYFKGDNNGVAYIHTYVSMIRNFSKDHPKVGLLHLCTLYFMLSAGPMLIVLSFI